MSDLSIVPVKDHVGDIGNFSDAENPGFFVFADGDLVLGWFPTSEAAGSFLNWVERMRAYHRIEHWLPGQRLPEANAKNTLGPTSLR